MKSRRGSKKPHSTPRPDDGNAFVPDTVGQARPIPAADAESFAEEFIGSATCATSISLEAADEVVDEEDGGPFIVLDDDARLPTVPEERSQDREGHDSVQREDIRRGARWASRARIPR
jgi:hypothetical protein